jgi:hypothetical protein
LIGAVSVSVAWPAVAHAHAFDVRSRVEEPTPTDDTAAPEATSSKAPESGDAMPEPTDPAPEPEPETQDESTAPATPPGEPEETTLDAERSKASSRAFNKHGIGVRGGITVVPTWILARYLDTHANALCRGEKVGNFAAKRGLLKTDGCNFYVAAEYVYRHSRILDIVGVVGYQRLHAPDAYWLDKGQNALNGVGGADYTEIKLDALVLEVDFIARYPVVITDDVEWGIGGGGGIGLGVVFGGIWQTALGDMPQGFSNDAATANTCRAVKDLADFRRCTPRYDPTEHPDYEEPDASGPGFLPPGPDADELSNPNPMRFANCGKDRCNTSDLERFGYRNKAKAVPPVIPIVNLVISTRLIIKDVFGITLSGGWNTGFYFGGSLNYFFGKQFAKTDNEGPAPTARLKRPSMRAGNGVAF